MSQPCAITSRYLDLSVSPTYNPPMSALETKLTETLRSLDPARAKALETAFLDILMAVQPETKPAPEVDANGWPVGYWEHFAGILAGDDFEPPDDPPPEQHPY